MPELSLKTYKDDITSEIIKSICAIIENKIQEKGWKLQGAPWSRESLETIDKWLIDDDDDFCFYFIKKSFFSKKHMAVVVSKREIHYLANIGTMSAESASEFDDAFEAVADYLNKKELERQKKNQDLSIRSVSKHANLSLSTHFIQTLKANQSKIDPSLIPKFLKLQEFYEAQLSQYNRIHKTINSSGFYKKSTDEVQEDINELEYSFKIVTNLEAAMNLMIDSCVNGDLITFYSIYNKFDEKGLFMNGAEKIISGNLQSLNSTVEYVASSIHNVNRSVKDLNENLDRFRYDITGK